MEQMLPKIVDVVKKTDTNNGDIGKEIMKIAALTDHNRSKFRRL